MLWIMYSLQGAIIPTGGTLYSQFILMLAIIIGLYYTIKVINMRNKPIYFIGLNLLFLLFTIYGIILLFENHNFVIKAKLFDDEVTSYSYLKSIFMSLPNIYAFYYFSRKGYLTETSLKKWIIVFFGVAIFKFFDFQLSTIKAQMLNGSDVDEITNNMGYQFTALIPAVILFKKNIKLQLLLLIVCIIFIVSGMKRGAILIGAISLFYFIYFNFRYNKNISKNRIIALLAVLLISGFFVIKHMIDTSDYFNDRIVATKEGSTSGRDEIYTHFYNHFINETDEGKFFFGNGANATLDIGINYAHNDWLEIAINQGVLGLIIYVIYWCCFLRTISVSRHNKDAMFVITLTFIVFFIKTFFSMSYTDYGMMSCITFSYFLAHNNSKWNFNYL